MFVFFRCRQQQQKLRRKEEITNTKCHVRACDFFVIEVLITPVVGLEAAVAASAAGLFICFHAPSHSCLHLVLSCLGSC